MEHEKPIKTARFFCENCGRAVPFDASMCPHCGKSFDAVKCPVCNYTGMPGEFLQGCPECGYLTPEQKEERAAALSQRAKNGIPALQNHRGRKKQRKDSRRSGHSSHDEVLFADYTAPEKKIIQSVIYFLILVLLAGTLAAMALILLF